VSDEALPILEAEPPQPPRPRFWRRVLLTFALVIVVVGVVLFRQAQVAPTWYAPPDVTDEEVQVFAETVEYKVMEAFHEVREPEKAWDLILPEEHLNAWLAARLPEWIAHEHQLKWPEDLGAPQVRMGRRGIDLAVEVSMGDGARVVTARVVPAIREGAIALDVDRVGLGRVTLPGEPATSVAELIERYAPDTLESDGAQWMLSFLRGEQRIDTIMDLADGRTVELLEMELGKQKLRLRSRTLSGTTPDEDKQSTEHE
jgi:hypothetical protein